MHDNAAARSAVTPVPANRSMNPTGALPAILGEAEDGGKPPSQFADICDRLAQLQKRRVACIKAQSRCDRSVDAYLAVLLGDYDMPKTRRATKEEKEVGRAIFAAAQKLRIRIESAGEKWKDGVEPAAIDAVVPLVLNSANSRKPWDRERALIEKDMCRLAKSLPIWKHFAEEIKGFGEKGLAIIIGEAGDRRGRTLADYGTVAKLWTRMQLGLVNEDGVWVRQQRRTGDLALTHNFVPERRGQIYGAITEPLFKHQWRGARCTECDKAPDKCKCGEPKPEVIPAHAQGPYGEEYGRKKAEYLLRDRKEWPLARCENGARRYMTKCLIRDLWVAWRREISIPAEPMPAASPAALPAPN